MHCADLTGGIREWDGLSGRQRMQKVWFLQRGDLAEVPSDFCRLLLPPASHVGRRA